LGKGTNKYLHVSTDGACTVRYYADLDDECSCSICCGEKAGAFSSTGFALGYYDRISRQTMTNQ